MYTECTLIQAYKIEKNNAIVSHAVMFLHLVYYRWVLHTDKYLVTYRGTTQQYRATPNVPPFFTSSRVFTGDYLPQSKTGEYFVIVHYMSGFHCMSGFRL